MNVRLQHAPQQMARIAVGMAVALAVAQSGWGQVPPAPPRPAAQQPMAAQAASVVEGHVVPAGDLTRIAAQLAERFQGRGDVRIAADPRTRKIVAVAPPDVQRDIAAWLIQNAGASGGAAENPAPREPLDVQPAAGQRSAQRLDLRNSNWKDFEERLFRIWGGRLSAATNEAGDMAQFQIKGGSGVTALQIDRRNGQVTIDAPGQSAGAWLKILQTIDSPRQAAGQESRVVPLDKADPAMVLRAVSLIRSALGSDLFGRGLSNRKNHIGQFVSMIFQPEAGAAQPPAQPPPGPPPVPGQPPGEGAPPGEGQPGAEGAEGPAGETPIGNVTIEIVGDVLVVRGRKADVDRVLKIIDEIERQSIETRPEVELYPLKYVDATALNEVLTTVSTTAFSYQGTVTITALKRPNALLLVGRKEAIPAIIELIQKLDKPTPFDSQLRVFPLKHLSAVDAERFVRAFFVELPGTTTTARTNLGTRVMVIADFRSNSLVVQANPRDMAEVTKLLAMLDVDDTPAKNEMRVFKLRNSLAEELAPALQEAITGVAAGGGQGQGQQQAPQQPGGGGAAGGATPATSSRIATSLQLLKKDKDGQRLIQSGVLSNMRIIADTRSNSLLVIGPPSSMELMATLVQQLDELPTAESQIKVFTLSYGDASTLITMLQNLFGTTTANQANQLNLQTATGSGESTLVPLRFSVDVRTNSIIASGNPGDLEVVRNILLFLDVPDQTQRITTVYRLHHAPATDVATAINNLLDRQRSLNQAAPDLVTPYQIVAQEVMLEPEPVTNSLIVSATPKYFEQIKAIVTELDKRPPMVVIQVLIAEVTLAENEQFGIEWGLQDSLLFDRGLTGGPRFAWLGATPGNDAGAASLATRNSLAGQAISSFSTGRTDPTLGFGGLVLSASSESVNVLLRALQQSSRAQVISRPQVQTLDNLPAYVNVGALVPRITGGSASTIGTFNPVVQDISVGIILEVTPRTSDDGTIVMQINATKSSVGPDATGIPIFTDAAGNVVRSPQIPLTTAQTTVSARSGQTVILGGLITKDQSEITRRIPYLGDIPMLGRLFRYDVYSDKRTELLVIMTPFIMQTEEQNAWLNARESERMSWCIADVVNIHGPVGGLGGNPAYNTQPSDVIFPDVDPTAPKPIPATPAPPQPNNPLLPPAPAKPPLPNDPLLPPAPPGYGGLQLPPPVQTAPPAAGAVGSALRGVPGTDAPPNDLRSIQPPAIQQVAPPPGTQARLAPQGPPQWPQSPQQQLPPSGWGQGYAPPGPVSPAVYQQPEVR